MATWKRFERDEPFTGKEEFVELTIVGCRLLRLRGERTRSAPMPAPSSKDFKTEQAAQRALATAVASLENEGFVDVGDVVHDVPEPSPEQPVADVRPRISVDDERWLRWATRLNSSGIDPLAPFWDQSLPASAAGEGFERKLVDAEARAIACLRVARDMFGAKLPPTGGSHDMHDPPPPAWEWWVTPVTIFEVATGVSLRRPVRA